MDRKEAGSKGGKVKNPKKGAGSLTPEERKLRAQQAARARWSKHEKTVV